MHRLMNCSVICFAMWLVLSGPLLAQQDPDKTLLEIEIVLPLGRLDFSLGHRWAQEFKEAGELARVRGAIPDDRPTLKEHSRGTFKSVRMVGILDDAGRIQFPGRIFRLDETQKLKEWLQEIRLYGPQGSPDGQANWGLNAQQFQAFFTDCTVPVAQSTSGKTLTEVLLLIPILDQHLLEVHSLAKERWDAAQDIVIRSELQGISSGTALSYTLCQAGLVYRPIRRANGNLDLVVEQFEDVKTPWPLGWPIREGQNRAEIFPTFFKFQPMTFRGVSLAVAIQSIEEHSEVRVLLDERSIQLNQIDVDAKLVNIPQGNNTFARVLRTMLTRSNLRYEFLLDESGVGFVLINPTSSYQPSAPNQPSILEIRPSTSAENSAGNTTTGSSSGTSTRPPVTPPPPEPAIDF